MNLSSEIVLSVVLLVSAGTDLWRKTIYNLVTLPAMIAGLILGWYYGGLAGLGWSALALAACGLLLLLPFMLGGMGGGDVKLMAAVGALSGLNFALHTLLYACMLGGTAALLLMIAEGRLGEGLRGTWLFIRQLTDRNLEVLPPQPLKLPTLPFAVCILGGAVWARWFDFLPVPRG